MQLIDDRNNFVKGVYWIDLKTVGLTLSDDRKKNTLPDEVVRAESINAEDNGMVHYIVSQSYWHGIIAPIQVIAEII